MKRFYVLSKMSANEDWDDWLNRFVERIVQTLRSEGAICQTRGVVMLSGPENGLGYTKAVNNNISGNQKSLDNPAKSQKGKLKKRSIGQIYEASLLAPGVFKSLPQLGIRV